MVIAHTLGVHTGQQDCSLDELRRLWRFIDQAGFDWLSIWDHFYEAPPIDGNGPCFEAVSALTLLATETSRVRVGCLVFCVSYRHPAVLAKALATIDHISSGRLEAGLGAGWHEQEYREYGIAFPPSGCARISSKKRRKSYVLCLRRSPPRSSASTFKCRTLAAIPNLFGNGSHYGLAVPERNVLCAPLPDMLMDGILLT